MLSCCSNFLANDDNKRLQQPGDLTVEERKIGSQKHKIALLIGYFPQGVLFLKVSSSLQF